MYKRERAQECRSIRKKKDGVWTEEPGNRISARTAQAELAELNMAITHEVDNQRLATNPVARFCTVDVPPPARVVLDEGYADGPEWQAIYEAAGKSEGYPRGHEDRWGNQLVCLFLYETGMRSGEAFQVRESWIKMLRPTRWMIEVDIDNAGTKAHRRKVPVSDKLRLALESKLSGDPEALLFPSTVTGAPRKSFSHGFKAILSRANLADREYTPHALRRTRISIWDAKDGPACRYATGHAPIDVHERNYLRITDERLFKLVGLEYRPMEVYREAM
jgi:integrase